MLNANNEINIKKEERKHSWSTVFAWLYLKTIGRILPKRWNRWAENILYYDKATANNEVQTDAFKTLDESAQVDLKPEVAEKESQSEIMSKDGEVQTDRVTFQDMTIQTEHVEKANKNIEVDLKPEIAEKESQSVVINKDGGVQTDGVAFQHTVMQTECVEKIDKSVEVNLKSEVAEKDGQRKLKDENEKLKGELEGANQALKAFIGLCDDQAQQIANLQTGNDLLEEENGELKSKLAELEKSYRELAEVVDKRGKEFLAKLKERSETIVRLEGELIKLSAEFANKTRKLSVEGKEKDAKINNLKWLGETLAQNKKAMQDKVDEQQKTISDQEKRMKEQDALFKSLTDKNEAVEKDNESIRMQIMELGGKVSELGREKEALQSNVNTLTAQLQSVQESKQQLEEEKSNIEQQKQAELEQTICKNAELEIKVSELRKEKAQFKEQLEAMKEERKTHEENQHKLEGRLSTATNKKKNLENGVAELQKQVQTLERNKEWELAGIDGTLKETSLTIMELLAQQLLLNNQEQSVKEKKLEELTLSYSDQVHQIAGLQAENLSLEVKNGKLLSVIERSITEEAEVRKMDEKIRQNQHKLIDQIKKLEEALKEKDAQCKQLKESLCALEGLEYRLESLESQSTTAKVQQQKEQKGAVEQLTKERKEITNLRKELVELEGKLKTSEDEVNKLQEEKRNMKKQLEIMQQQLLNEQEQQKVKEELKSVDKRLKDINEKTRKSQEQTKIQRKPLQDKNLEYLLSDQNMSLKKDFPEFKEKNFLLNFLRETVKFLSNKQDDKFQGRELLNLFKSNLKKLAKKVIENRVKEVVINKGNKYYQVSKNIDKELLDGTICRDKLKDELSRSVGRCMKKLELDVKDTITITNSIVDKFCDRENNNKSPALREIVVRYLTEAKMKTFLEKVREINLVPSDAPSPLMYNPVLAPPLDNARPVVQR